MQFVYPVVFLFNPISCCCIDKKKKYYFCSPGLPAQPQPRHRDRCITCNKTFCSSLLVVQKCKAIFFPLQYNYVTPTVFKVLFYWKKLELRSADTCNFFGSGSWYNHSEKYRYWSKIMPFNLVCEQNLLTWRKLKKKKFLPFNSLNWFKTGSVPDLGFYLDSATAMSV